jgi:hypothetical protein
MARPDQAPDKPRIQEAEEPTMADPNQSLDSRRIAREQEARLAASSLIGLNAAKPFIQFHASMLRVISETCEIMANNYEKGLEAFGAAIEQRSRQSHQ